MDFESFGASIAVVGIIEGVRAMLAHRTVHPPTPPAHIVPPVLAYPPVPIHERVRRGE